MGEEASCPNANVSKRLGAVFGDSFDPVAHMHFLANAFHVSAHGFYSDV